MRAVFPFACDCKSECMLDLAAPFRREIACLDPDFHAQKVRVPLTRAIIESAVSCREL